MNYSIFKQCLYYIFVILTLLNVTLAEKSKIRRNANIGGTSGLYVFPRVGRSDPTINRRLQNDAIDNKISIIDLPYHSANSIEDYEDYSHSDIKRGNLVAFPRVGRTNNNIQKLANLMALEQALDRHAGSTSTTGVWFGPRLGKRNTDILDENDHLE